MTLGEKLLELRRKSAVSQDALAEKLGVSRQAVSKWEREFSHNLRYHHKTHAYITSKQ